MAQAVLNRQNYMREYRYGGETVLTAGFESYIVETEKTRAEEEINNRINTQLREFMRKNTRLFAQAAQSLRDAQKNGFPFRQYETLLKYTPTYNSAELLSMYRDYYEYTGGAHGNTVRKSDTWSLMSGKVLPLSAFFPKNSDYKAIVLEEILRQAKENYARDPIYFENYPELILKTFDPESFYLTEKGIAVYFQQYDIAPYAAGIQVFIIPFSS